MTDTALLHDPYLREFDAARDRQSTRSTARTAVRSIARRSIRPPAASRSTPARSGALACVDVVDARGRRRSARRRRRRSRAGARCTARSTGPAASITCSSTPASTCCRRPSTGCSTRAPRAFISAPTTSTIDLGARSDAAGDRRAPKTTPTAWSGKTGRCSIRFVGRDGGRHAAAPQGTGVAKATLRLIDVDGLRPVGLRRHARRAHRRDRRSSRSPAGSASRADRGSSSSAAAARCARIARLRDVAAASSRLLSVCADELPAAIERLQAEAARPPRSSRTFRRSSPATKPRLWRRRRRTGASSRPSTAGTRTASRRSPRRSSRGTATSRR